MSNHDILDDMHALSGFWLQSSNVILFKKHRSPRLSTVSSPLYTPYMVHGSRLTGQSAADFSRDSVGNNRNTTIALALQEFGASRNLIVCYASFIGPTPDIH